MCDFNEAMWQHEHFSETPRSERQMMDFREVLSHCDLHDLGFAGLPWTYNNNRDGAANVRMRLDRAVANTEWSDVFPDACVRHIGTVRSDHKLLLLRLQDGGSHARGNMTFHYEIMWEREEGLNAVVERSWNSRRAGDDLGSVAASLQRLTEELKIWSKNNFGQVTKKIEELREEMEQLEREDPIQKRAQVLENKAQLDEHLYREEMTWLQRSRISWLKEGDQNTRYFHRKARWRAKKNWVRKLQRDDGSWCCNNEEMAGMAVDYFSNLFTADNSVVPDEIVDLFEPKVSEDMNLSLCKEFSEEEISNALF
jgi:hypothetical protein